MTTAVAARSPVLCDSVNDFDVNVDYNAAKDDKMLHASLLSPLGQNEAVFISLLGPDDVRQCLTAPLAQQNNNSGGASAAESSYRQQGERKRRPRTHRSSAASRVLSRQRGARARW